MGSVISKTRLVDSAPKSGKPTRLSDQSYSITKIDRYGDRRTVERFLEAKFGPRITKEHGIDVLMWLVESKDGVIQITAPRPLTDGEIRGIQQHAKAARSSTANDLAMTYGGNDVQY